MLLVRSHKLLVHEAHIVLSTKQHAVRTGVTWGNRLCLASRKFTSRSLASSQEATATASSSADFQFSCNAYLQNGESPRPPRKSQPTPNAPDLSKEAGSNTESSSATAIEIAKALSSCQSSPSEVFPGSAPVKPKVSTSRSSVGTKSIYKAYLELSKPKLTALVVLSAMSAYALAPSETTLANLLFLTVGTALCSSSANAINMAREYLYDGMMSRTRTRPVVRGAVSPRNAFIFAAACGVIGVTSLYYGVNPTVAALGFTNIVLYAGIYTTLKRVSISNTWVGAVVGAIPPLMGWASSNSLAEPGAWALAALLYCWQFPHFMALSHNIRGEYHMAGYVMAAWTNPALNARVALRHSIAMFPICFALAYFNVTDWFFVVDSAIVNSWLTFTAFKFWQIQKDNHQPLKLGAPAPPCPHARQLFWGSVIHLPAVLVLAMIHKKGHWDNIKARLGLGTSNGFA